MKKWLITLICLISLMIVSGIIYTHDKEKVEYVGYMEYSDTYDENDLKTEVKKDESGIRYIEISGLKNKKIQKKINKKLYDISDEYIKNGKTPSPRVALNAYNILSVSYSDKAVNIDLTTGNEIKLKDIIDSDNITPIISQAYYDSITMSLKATVNNKKLTIRLNEAELINEKDEEKIKQYNETIEQAKQAILQLEEMLGEVLERSVIYAKRMDDNVNFEIYDNSIRIPNIDLGIKINRNYITIGISEETKLNFYYKYMTKESIYDGTYTGKKEIKKTKILYY